jgi:DNA helicase II / ATP-dependent DNA helicase PcrA
MDWDINNEKNENEGLSSENERLLKSFLNEMEKKNLPHHNVNDDLTPYHYEEPEHDPNIDTKIQHLQQITRAIEKKPTASIDLAQIQQNSYKINYPESLNRAQLAAAVLFKGPMLVIAGAGSGKTRIITYRVSFMLENGVDPGSMLLLTFTRKAAREMLARVEKLLQTNVADKLPGGTFHAFANYILRRYANFLNIHPNFTIIDAEDSADIIDLLKTELKLNRTGSRFPKKNRIQEIISASRNRMLSIREIVDREYSGLIEFVDQITLIAQGYKKYKQISNVFDYDDLLEMLYEHLKNNKSFRKKLQEKYHYILVDEFQDTNIVQKGIVDFLAEKHRNIMVVGDDAQSIYAFRGANYENILKFPETFPECKVVKIEQNYRSNQAILNFTNGIIDNAKLGYKKKLFSKITRNSKPVIQKFFTQQDEATFITDKVLELRETGIELNQIAVLCRAAWHSNYIQTELLRRSIPYITVGGLKFNERRHIKDMIAYLRVMLNPNDAAAWHRLLKLIPGIGKVTAGNIIRGLESDNNKISFNKFNNKKFYDELVLLAEMLNSANKSGISLTNRLEIIKDYYAPILETKEYDYSVRMLDISVFIDLSAKYDDIEKFLSDFALDPPSRSFQDKGTPLVDEEEDKPLTISTVHSAKGLEWYTVFVPFALDGLFPSVRALKNFEELEEERRLFYVACSRAKEQLYITMPSQVVSYNAFFSYPSRFISELDKQFYTS